MIAEILATGDEILSGATAERNAAVIAPQLEAEGIAVVRHNCVGDDPKALAAVLTEMAARADVGVVTGGLGPTADDITAEAAALAAGVPLVADAAALASLEAFFQKRRRLLSPSNRKQALLPQGAECLVNPIGTAPGFAIRLGHCDLFFMPGVPHEMRHMLAAAVMPRIRRRLGRPEKAPGRLTVATFGLTEAVVGEKLDGFEAAFPQLHLGLCAEFPEIRLRIIAPAGTDDHGGQLLAQARQWVAARLGRCVLSFDGESMAAVIGRLLRQGQATLGVAESCSGGLLADMLTDVSGSSDYFLFGAVTYSNHAKVDVLGVSAQTIERCGAVAEETAAEMAAGVRRRAGAVYGISTTGVAGPTGGTVAKPVGTVCVGLCGPFGTLSRRHHFFFDNRRMHKRIFAYAAMDLLRQRLLDDGR